MASHPSPSDPSASAPPAGRLLCPFCGNAESERLRVEDKLVVIFPCMFSPVLDPTLSDEELRVSLAAFATKGSGYFQEQCDRLHYFVTKGAGTVLPDQGARPSPGSTQGPD